MIIIATITHNYDRNEQDLGRHVALRAAPHMYKLLM